MQRSDPLGTNENHRAECEKLWFGTKQKRASSGAVKVQVVDLVSKVCVLLMGCAVVGPQMEEWEYGAIVAYLKDKDITAVAESVWTSSSYAFLQQGQRKPVREAKKYFKRCAAKFTLVGESVCRGAQKHLGAELCCVWAFCFVVCASFPQEASSCGIRRLYCASLNSTQHGPAFIATTAILEHVLWRCS